MQRPKNLQKAAASTGEKSTLLPLLVLWWDTRLLLSGDVQGDTAPASEGSRVMGKTDITGSSCEHRAAPNSLLIISQVFFYMTLHPLD